MGPSVASRTTQQIVKNFTIEMPTKAGAYGLHYPYTSTNRPGCPASGAINAGLYPQACYNERMEGTDIENLNFEGSSGTAMANIYFEGDCLACVYKNLSQRSTGAGSTYNTILIMADSCYFSGAENTEACGPNLSVIENMSAGTTGGGAASVFVGRMGDTHFNTSFCDGSYGASATPYCYAFYNSAGNFTDGLFTEGGGGVFFLPEQLSPE